MEIKRYLQQLRDEGNFREIPNFTKTGVIDFSTNDYMGLSADDALQERFFADPAARKVPMTSSAARLLAPRQIEYANLEVFLRLLYAARRGDDTGALMFNSGYHANTGLIPAIASSDTYIIADKLVHASIIDGIILSRAPYARFPHNDFDRLEAMLERKAGEYGNVLVIVESVYSMDGDSADIERLIALKRRYRNVMLYVDEAHAFGVLGPRGLGLAAASSDPGMVDVVVGTFGKAAASMGAFAITGCDLRDYLVNTSRSFIFSTAIPPIQAAWTRFTLGSLVRMDAERGHLAELGSRLRNVIHKYSPVEVVPSHIQPLIVGDSRKAVELSHKLYNIYGIKALPIRKPTVPAGTERLRFSLNASMTFSDIDTLDHALGDLLPAINPPKL